jgi:hypothetical protein
MADLIDYSSTSLRFSLSSWHLQGALQRTGYSRSNE